jgi:superfamily II DNA/RNA helicase
MLDPFHNNLIEVRHSILSATTIVHQDLFPQFKALSNVQHQILSNFNSKQNILIGAQTGSGKTVGYLIALFKMLKEQEEIKSADFDPSLGKPHEQVYEKAGLSDPLVLHRKLLRPRSIVLLPSRELVMQVARTAKSLALGCKLSVLGLHSKTTRVGDKLGSPIDVLITTPNSLISSFKRDIKLTNCQKLIVDEADTLYDDSFIKDTEQIINLSNDLGIPKFLTTATVTGTLASRLDDTYKKILMSSLHLPPSKLRQDFLRVGQSATKPQLLFEILRKAVDQTQKVIVFCNTTENATMLYDLLISKRYPCSVLHANLQYVQVKNTVREFIAQPEFHILITTDILSRGIDTEFSVGQVVLYDFPKTSADYLARVGRTARFGSPGRATSLVGVKDHKFAEYVRQCVIKRLPIK